MNIVASRAIGRARCKACWVMAGVFTLIVASFASLNLQWADFLAPDALVTMGKFMAGFFPPETSAPFLAKAWQALLETLAMSALGTLLAALLGLALALPAAKVHADDPAWTKPFARLLLNALRSVPELVWASLQIGRASCRERVCLAV